LAKLALSRSDVIVSYGKQRRPLSAKGTRGFQAGGCSGRAASLGHAISSQKTHWVCGDGILSVHRELVLLKQMQSNFMWLQKVPLSSGSDIQVLGIISYWNSSVILIFGYINHIYVYLYHIYARVYVYTHIYIYMYVCSDIPW
jgi:hypothetical protein